MAKKSIDPLPFDGPSLKHKHDLDQMKCPEENVEIWKRKECKAYKKMEQRSSNLSNISHLRYTLLRYMEATCQQVALQMSDWYTCALYFDTHCATADVQVHDLPAICVGIVAIVKKMDKSGLERLVKPGFKTYLSSANRIAAWLRDKGYNDVSEDVTEEQVGLQEKCVMKSMKWILHVPTIDTWLTAFWMRLNVFTGGHFAPQLQSLYASSQLSVVTALRWFTLGQAVSCDLTPRTIASGIFCQGLVRVGLLPSEVLQGSGSSWQDLFNIPQFQPAQCDLRGEHDYRHMLGRLEAATGSDVATLRDDCEAVASVFVELSQTIKNSSADDRQRVAQNPRGILHHTSV